MKARTGRNTQRASAARQPCNTYYIDEPFARSGQLAAARPALVSGAVGVVLAPHGRLTRALRITFRRGRIAEVDIAADRDTLRGLEIAVLGDR